MNPISSRKINKVEITTDTLSSRGGLTFFVKYLESIEIYRVLLEKFSKLKKNQKGVEVGNLFKQVLCFFFDGTSAHLSYFDELAADEGYAAVLENEPARMASSHTMKRFFKAFGVWSGAAFRWVLQRLWIWRLKLEKPELIVVTVDTMVMDNDEALKRDGCDPTYKKKKGFQPLQLIWEGKIVDAIFRRGKKHSNYGKQAAQLLEKNVTLIREHYSWEVPIIVRLDSGFLDEHTSQVLEELSVGFIATGKITDPIKKRIAEIGPRQWKEYDNGRQRWAYAGFRYRCESWEKGQDYRALYTRPKYEGQQELLEFARPDNIIFTNLEPGTMAWEMLDESQRAQWLEEETIIESHHQRGADELPHRGLKDFGGEQLPFKRFAPNRAYYYLMVISFFLFETFKEDGLEGILPVNAYPTTIRRRLVDLAAKVVCMGHEIILKVGQAAMTRLQLDLLFKRCCQAPCILQI